MVVMEIANPFFTDIVAGVEDYVQNLGYTVQLGNSAEQVDREAAHLALFEEHRVRGVLFVPIREVGDRVARLRRHGIPVVVVDRAGDKADYCTVAVDDVEGGRLAVAHLVDLGHQRIAFVGGPSSLQQVRDRSLGAQIAASRLNTPGALLTMSTSRLDTESGVRAAGEIALMPETERPKQYILLPGTPWTVPYCSLVDLASRVEALTLNKKSKVEQFIGAIGEWIGFRGFFNGKFRHVDRRVIQADQAFELELWRALIETRHGDAIAEDVENPSDVVGLWRNRQLQLEEPLVVAVARPKHDPVLAKRHRTFVGICGDVMNRQNGHYPEPEERPI